MTLKEQLFNRDTVGVLARNIKRVYPVFNESAFINDCVKGFPPKELKERMSHVTHQLTTYLTDDYVKNIGILTETLKGITEPMFVSGSVMEYVQMHGCNDEYVDLSLQKLGEFTSSLSAEFAIRRFLNHYPEKTLSKVMEWTQSDDVHQRRLASEGTRPSLPWAPKITVPYKEASIALDKLYYDTNRYVTRSVANHLNDISKIDPEFVLQKLTKWRSSKKQLEDEMTYIIKHSLRTLVKKGHTNTLIFLGYSAEPQIKAENLQLSTDRLKVGDVLEFSFDILPLEDTKLVIDYIVKYPTKHGKTTQKIYKLTSVSVNTNTPKTITGKRSFKNLSTRTMRPGQHEIYIQINGTIYLSKQFQLVA